MDTIPDLGNLNPVPTTPKRLREAGETIAQELALAALLGGNLFGRVAMNPALRAISAPQERGKVLNRAWRRYGTVNSMALAALLGGWIPARRRALGGLRVSGRDRGQVLVRDIAVGTVVVTGLASAAGGVGFAHEVDGGAVPLESGAEPSPETPPRAARLKRIVNVLGGLNLAAEVALLVLQAT